MSFKKKIYRFAQEFLKDAGIGIALLGAGALAFRIFGLRISKSTCHCLFLILSAT